MIRSLSSYQKKVHQWAAIDFSQQEPRILVHYASAFSAKQATGKVIAAAQRSSSMAYRHNNPNMDFHDDGRRNGGDPAQTGEDD